MDDFVEDVWISERLVGEMMSLEVAPDDLDVVEFGRVFRQPFDGEPMGALGKRCRCRLADMDGSVVEHNDDWLCGRSGLGAVEVVEGLQMAMKSVLRLVREVVTMSWRLVQSSVPIMATFLDCPGAGTRKSAPRLAQARAR